MTSAIGSAAANLATEAEKNKTISWGVQRDDLLAVLKLVSGITESASTLKILSFAKIKVFNETMMLTTSNSDMQLTGETPLHTPFSGEHQVCLCIRKLLDICRSFQSGAVINFVSEQNWVYVRSDSAEFRLACLSANQFPSVDFDHRDVALTLPALSLAYLFNKASFSMGVQDVRFYLNGLLLESNGEEVSSAASDGHRLAFAALPLQGLKIFSILIPRKAVLEIIKLYKAMPHGDFKIEINKTHIKIQHHGCLFISTLLQTPSLNYRELLPKEFSSTVSLDNGRLKSALSRSMILSHERFSQADLQVQVNQTKILSRNMDQEKTQETIPSQFSAEKLTVALNVYYLYEVLSVIESETIELNFFGENNALLLKEASTLGWAKYIIMPLAVD
jgi:DNA polymerase III subunit beta